jgi:protein involved in polysaccharide export with SLBB domain
MIGSVDLRLEKKPEASVPVAVVRPGGKITAPMVKEVEVGGRTPALAEERISAKLKEFIADASVTQWWSLLSPARRSRHVAGE